jgi:hypothetical protein
MATTTTQLVLAAIAGGGLTALVAAGTRRAEFAREDHARWLMQRRDAYVAYLDATHRLSRLTLGSTGNAAAALSQERRQDEYIAVQAIVDDMRAQVDTLELLGPRYVLQALMRVQGVIMDIRLATVGPQFNIDVQELPKRLQRARADFRQAARRDLGLNRINAPWIVRKLRLRRRGRPSANAN